MYQHQPHATVDESNKEKAHILNQDRFQIIEKLLDDEVKHLIWLSQATMKCLKLDCHNSSELSQYNYYLQVRKKKKNSNRIGLQKLKTIQILVTHFKK